MKTLVVINPLSGGGKGRSVGARVRQLLGDGSHDVQFIEANSLADSLTSAEEICRESSVSNLICVGGDGLVHDLLPLTIKYNLSLLVIPAGTGNDFARTVGTYGRKVHENLNLLKGTARNIDLAIVESSLKQTPFVQILSTGFDSVVNARANNFKKIKGSTKYAVAVLMEIWRFKALNFRVTIDGLEIVQKAMLVCVANGTSYGAGMKIAPHAVNSDGLLDIMVLDEVNPIRLLLVFPRVFLGLHVKHPKVHFYRGSRVEIEGDTEAFADGERISGLPVKIFLSPTQLKVFAP